MGSSSSNGNFGMSVSASALFYLFKGYVVMVGALFALF
jgi:hypothetical protein